MVGRIVAFLGLLAIGLALAIAVAGPGTRLGLWDWSFGLSLIRKVSAPDAIPGLPVPPLILAAGLAFMGAIVGMEDGERAERAEREQRAKEWIATWEYEHLED